MVHLPATIPEERYDEKVDAYYVKTLCGETVPEWEVSPLYHQCPDCRRAAERVAKYRVS